MAEVKNDKKELDYSVVLAKFHSLPLAFYIMDKLENDDFYKNHYNKIYLMDIKDNIIEKIEF